MVTNDPICWKYKIKFYRNYFVFSKTKTGQFTFIHIGWLCIIINNRYTSRDGKGVGEMKRIIEGYTSIQEVKPSAWESYGKEKVYQLACNIYTNENLAKRVYGRGCYRKVRITMQELTAP